MQGREQELPNLRVGFWSNAGIYSAFQEHFKWHWWKRFIFSSVWGPCPDSVGLLARIRQIHFLGKVFVKGYLKPKGLLSASSSSEPSGYKSMMIYSTGVQCQKLAQNQNSVSSKSNLSPAETQLNPNRPKWRSWHEIKQLLQVQKNSGHWEYLQSAFMKYFCRLGLQCNIV